MRYSDDPKIGNPLKIQLKFLCLTLLLLGAMPAWAADPAPAGHKAIYKMTLASTKSTSIVSVGGQMYYKFSDTCDSWSSDQNFSLSYVYADQPEAKMGTQYTAHEAKNGNSYDFAIRRSKNGDVQERYEGSATRKPDGSGMADFAVPDKRGFRLAQGFLLPTQHTSEMIKQALAGSHILNAHLFDGTDGTGDVEVNAVIGNVIQPPLDGKLAGNKLLQSPARKIRLAFFHAAEKNGKVADTEAEPDYEMTMILHENGVVSSMQIDYDQFSLKGELEAIESVPVPKC